MKFVSYLFFVLGLGAANDELRALTYSSVEDFTPVLDDLRFTEYYSEVKETDTEKHGVAIDTVQFFDQPAAASVLFSGEPGFYKLVLHAVAEEDGESEYEILINNVSVGKFKNPEVEEKRVLIEHDYGEFEFSVGDEISVVFKSHSNFKIPEGEGYAWARGRWRRLVLQPIVNPSFDKLVVSKNAMLVWQTHEEVIVNDQIETVVLRSPLGEEIPGKLDESDPSRRYVRLLPNVEGIWTISGLDAEGNEVMTKHVPATFFKYTGPLTLSATNPSKFAGGFGRTKKLLAMKVNWSFFGESISAQTRNPFLYHFKEYGGSLVIVEDMALNLTKCIVEGELDKLVLKNEVDGFLEKTVKVFKNDLNILLESVPLDEVAAISSAAIANEVQDYLKSRFSNGSYVMAPSLFDEPFGGSLPFHPSGSKRLYIDPFLEDALVMEADSDISEALLQEVRAHLVDDRPIICEFDVERIQDNAFSAGWNNRLKTIQKISHELLSDPPIGEALEIGKGCYPDFCFGVDGSAHILYARAGSAYYRQLTPEGELGREEFTGITYDGSINDGPQRSDPEILIKSNGDLYALTGKTLAMKQNGAWRVIARNVGRDTSMVMDSKENIFINIRGGFHGGHVGVWILDGVTNQLSPALHDPDTGTAAGVEWIGKDHPYGQLFMGPDDGLHLVYRQGKPDYIAWRTSADRGNTWTGGGVYGYDLWQGEAPTGLCTEENWIYVVGPFGHVFRKKVFDEPFEFVGKALGCGSRDLPDVLLSESKGIFISSFGGRYTTYQKGRFADERYLPSPDAKEIGFVALAANPMDQSVWSLYETGDLLNKENLSGTGTVWLLKIAE
ncbi:MAG: hypothetical protein MI748_08995 [Opitutales bacterium]|nr:hypothetical protein [Opitutales bacterium]